jgi:hypothetical protein
MISMTDLDTCRTTYKPACSAVIPEPVDTDGDGTPDCEEGGTYCGDGIAQQPNDNQVEEQCDKLVTPNMITIDLNGQTCASM